MRLDPLLIGLLDPDPKVRITALRILIHNCFLCDLDPELYFFYFMIEREKHNLENYFSRES
jgi:hypothetical protein